MSSFQSLTVDIPYLSFLFLFYNVRISPSRLGRKKVSKTEISQSCCYYHNTIITRLWFDGEFGFTKVRRAPNFLHDLRDVVSLVNPWAWCCQICQASLGPFHLLLWSHFGYGHLLGDFPPLLGSERNYKIEIHMRLAVAIFQNYGNSFASNSMTFLAAAVDLI